MSGKKKNGPSVDKMFEASDHDLFVMKMAEMAYREMLSNILALSREPVEKARLKNEALVAAMKLDRESVALAIGKPQILRLPAKEES